MARGKAGKAAAARRLAAARAAIADLEQQIAEETAALDDVRRAVAAADAVAADVRAEHAAAASEAAGEEGRLAAQADTLATLIAEHTPLAAQAQRAWDRVSAAGINSAPGATHQERFEFVMRLFFPGTYLNDGEVVATALSDSPAEHHKRLIALQRLRGVRSTGGALPSGADDRPGDGLPHGTLPKVQVAVALRGLRPALQASLNTALAGPEEGWEPVLNEIAEAVYTAGDPSRGDLDALGLWYPSPFFRGLTLADRPHHIDPTRSQSDLDRTSEGEVLATLGHTARPSLPGAGDPAASPSMEPPSEGSWPSPTASLPAATRLRLAAADPGTAITRWRDRFTVGAALSRIAGPHGDFFARGPLSPRPGRAAVLRHHYAASASAGWLLNPAAAEATFPTAHGEVALGLCTAASFWLPSGQTHAFADSEPLDEAARAEMVLPFPQVFLAFAEPLLLDAVRDADAAEAHYLAGAIREVAIRAGSHRPLVDAAFSLLRRLRRPPVGHWRDGLPTAGDILDISGARVEGLLLLGDSLGRPSDLFGWCLAIPGGPNSVLGRVVVPASRERTAYRDLVDNLTAVAAWADWHEPDTETSVPPGATLATAMELMDTPVFARDAERHGAEVRVLNVRTTTKSESVAAGTGREVAPHVRRGHWRRQRFGVGNKQVRRVRIAPVLVNAHRGMPVDRVYRLPTPSATSSATS